MSLSSFSYLIWLENCTLTPFRKTSDGAVFILFETKIYTSGFVAIKSRFRVQQHKSQIFRRHWSPLMLAPNTQISPTNIRLFTTIYLLQCNCNPFWLGPAGLRVPYSVSNFPNLHEPYIVFKTFQICVIQTLDDFDLRCYLLRANNLNV